MLRRWLCASCALLLVLPLVFTFAPASASADPFTPTPEPTSMPLPLNRCVQVEAYCDGEWRSLRSHLVYSHMQGMYADGILHFMPLEDFIRNEEALEIPKVKLTADFDIRVSFDEQADGGYSSFAVWGRSADALEQCMNEKPVWSELSEGLYLIAISHSVSKGQEYYSGMSFIWLEV